MVEHLLCKAYHIFPVRKTLLSSLAVSLLSLAACGGGGGSSAAATPPGGGTTNTGVAIVTPTVITTAAGGVTRRRYTRPNRRFALNVLVLGAGGPDRHNWLGLFHRRCDFSRHLQNCPDLRYGALCHGTILRSPARATLRSPPRRASPPPAANQECNSSPQRTPTLHSERAPFAFTTATTFPPLPADLR